MSSANMSCVMSSMEIATSLLCNICLPDSIFHFGLSCAVPRKWRLSNVSVMLFRDSFTGEATN